MKSLRIFLVCLYCLTLVTLVLGVPGSGGGGRSGGAFTGGRSSSGPKGNLGSPKSNGKQAVGTNLPAGESSGPKVAKTGGSFFSAWGIISLILFIIVGSALTYYISIFYPLVCAKRGKYDVMEMTAV